MVFIFLAYFTLYNNLAILIMSFSIKAALCFRTHGFKTGRYLSKTELIFHKEKAK